MPSLAEGWQTPPGYNKTAEKRTSPSLSMAVTKSLNHFFLILIEIAGSVLLTQELLGTFLTK